MITTTKKKARGLQLAMATFALACATQTGYSQLTITVGSHSLLPNTVGQEINIQVTGGQAVAGLNFNVQLGDGFPDATGSSVNGPNITGVDIVGSLHPTIFTANNTGQFDTGSGLQVAYRTTTTAAGTVLATGRLATLVIDTTGFSSGTFALNLADVFGGGTTFSDGLANTITPTITDGSITVVPEPAETAMVTGLAAAGLPVWLRRRKRGKPQTGRFQHFLSLRQ